MSNDSRSDAEELAWNQERLTMQQFLHRLREQGYGEENRLRWHGDQTYTNLGTYDRESQVLTRWVLSEGR
jgi:hypothetical protein